MREGPGCVPGALVVRLLLVLLAQESVQLAVRTVMVFDQRVSRGIDRLVRNRK